MMKVRELIELLQAEPNQEREVVMAKDAEGNGYSPLSGFWTGQYRAATTYYGDVGLEQLDDTLRSEGYGDEDVMTDGVPALILKPVN